jgi:hypothetical protein
MSILLRLREIKGVSKENPMNRDYFVSELKRLKIPDDEIQEFIDMGDDSWNNSLQICKRYLEKQ